MSPRFRTLADGTISKRVEDPLEVSPHERFENATETPNALDTYENVIRKMAKPVMVTASEQGLYAWREIVEVIARISWSYRVPRAQVEADLLSEGNRQLGRAIVGAATQGLLVDSQSGARIPREEGLKLIQKEHKNKLLGG